MSDSEMSPASEASGVDRLVMRDPHCQWCGNPCKVMKYRFGGHISECHGCGVGYENETGETVFENDDLRYYPGWDQ